jgi:hypothetical protein
MVFFIFFLQYVVSPKQRYLVKLSIELSNCGGFGKGRRNEVLGTTLWVVPDGFFYFSSNKQIPYEDKEKSDNENQVVILKYTI